jgi:hypothetical protein
MAVNNRSKLFPELILLLFAVIYYYISVLQLHYINHDDNHDALIKCDIYEAIFIFRNALETIKLRPRSGHV